MVLSTIDLQLYCHKLLSIYLHSKLSVLVEWWWGMCQNKWQMKLVCVQRMMVGK
jgi:hypothetical protein